MIDNYKTRQIDKFKIVKRIEKTVYGNPSELTLDQINNYNNNGFIVIKDFFNRSQIANAKSRSEEIFNNSIGYIVNKEPESNIVRSALQVHLLNEFRELIDKRLVNISRSILGGKTYLHQSRINYKHGKSANGWNWHSDFETWHSKDGMPNMNCFTAMAVIDDNTLSFIYSSEGSPLIDDFDGQPFIECMTVKINGADAFTSIDDGSAIETFTEKTENLSVNTIESASTFRFTGHFEGTAVTNLSNGLASVKNGGTGLYSVSFLDESLDMYP